jgi:pimeloyl-ACP methyl ester carboxylesterase
VGAGKVVAAHRRVVILGLLIVAAGTAPGLARAAVPIVPCHGSSGVRCATVQAPLDYAGTTPGQVSLAVEELPAGGTPRGVLLMVAGGPGQASAKVFDLAHNGNLWQLFFPGYTLVAYDDRGTGASGALSCPGLFTSEEDFDFDQIAALVGACGDSLGANRAFYATREHAEDIETVRSALGVDRLALWGTSYGTKHVLAYALSHPTHVERLLLDSVLRPEGPDVFGGDMLRGLPLALASLCHGSLCRSATANPVGDVVKLANRLAVKPLVGKVRVPGHASVALNLDGVDFLSLVVESDLNPGVAAELPAAVSSALAGRPAPLERLVVLANLGSSEPHDEFDVALDFATTCADGLFPWQPDTPVAERQAAVDAALAALPAGTTGPFGAWAAGFGTWQYCKAWPAPAGGAPLATGPLPDVPVLVLSGDRDMRTPTAGARAVAAGFPRAQVLVVPGVGHSVLTADFSLCTAQNVWAWLSGKALRKCKRVAPLVAPIARFPASVASMTPVEGVAGIRGRTLAAVQRTLAEAESAWLAANGHAAGGVYGGRLTPLSGLSFTLAGYSEVPGLTVSGMLKHKFTDLLSPLGLLAGTITVSGSRAAHGTLHVVGPVVSGTLAGKRVSR